MAQSTCNRIKKASFFTVLMLCMAAQNVSAYVDCRDTSQGCSLEQYLSLCQTAPISNEDRAGVCKEVISRVQTIIAGLTTGSVSTQASYTGPVCGSPGYCDNGRGYEEGKVPNECKNGMTFKNMDALKATGTQGAHDGNYIFRHNGQCASVTKDKKFCVMIRKNLVSGSTDVETNGEVSRLQKLLLDNGYIFPSEIVYPKTQGGSTKEIFYEQGVFGPQTQKGLFNLQKGLLGMDFVTLKSGFGPKTRTALQNLCP